MKNKPYPLYSLPKINDFKDMLIQRCDKAANSPAFTFSGKKDNIVTKSTLDFVRDINALGELFA